jgi:hypothetical protein
MPYIMEYKEKVVVHNYIMVWREYYIESTMLCDLKYY